MRVTHLGAAALVTLPLVSATHPLPASGPAAIYAIVDKVVIEPNEQAPERIQVWGTFSIWDGRSAYLDPARGYMYFAMPAPQQRQRHQGTSQPSAAVARAEWSDLKRVAGSTAGVAFGERGYWEGRLRRADEKPASPDAYPIYNGITQISNMDQVGPEIFAKLREAARRR